MNDSASPPLADGLFRLDGDVLTLLGGRSRHSGRSHFPLRAVCPYSGEADVEPVDLPRHGILWLCTEVTAAPPGYTGPVPYGLGIVELSDGLRVVGRVLADDPLALAPGTPMTTIPDTVPDPGGALRSTWAFAPT